MQTDRPMLFSGPMVRAMLREIVEPGTGKTMTRRLIMPSERFNVCPSAKIVMDVSLHVPVIAFEHPKGGPFTALLLHYHVGDRLWVREAIYFSPEHANFYYATDNRGVGEDIYLKLWERRARSPRARVVQPSMFMPRYASRLTLTVTDVRVERLQSISEADVRAEGIERSHHGGGDQWLNYPAGSSAAGWRDPRESFRTLWDSLNAKRQPWASNPWVIVIGFRPELRNIDAKTEAADAAA